MCGALAHVCFGPKADIRVSDARSGSGFWSTSLKAPIIVVRLSHDEDLVQYRALQARMERRVRRSLFALLVLTSTAHAQLVIFTYDQWQQLSIGLQEIYLAGAIDSLSTITTPPTAATAKYYNDCLVKKQITAHIIAEEMKAIVQTRPELRPKPATGALLQSLIKLCGLPVPDWPSPSQ
jgi:hypothetical protein